MTPFLFHRAAFTTALLLVMLLVNAAPRITTWRYEAESMDAAYGDNQRGEDKSASNGAFTWCAEGRNKPNYVFASGYYDLPQGRYRARWYLRVQQNVDSRAVLSVDVIQPGDRYSPVLPTVRLSPGDFKNPGHWETFEYEFDRTEMGRVQYRARYLGISEIAIDCLEIEFIRPFTEQELYERQIKHYPVQAPDDPAALWAQSRANGYRVLELADVPFGDRWRVAEAVAAIPDATFETRRWTKGWSVDFKPGDTYLPWSYEELFRYDAVVMTAGDARRLQATGRKMIADYVEAGGHLVVLGGYFSFGKGNWAGTRLESLAGVTTHGPWDLAAADGALLQTEGTHGHAAIEPEMAVDWLHVVTAARGTRTLWQCAGKPALLERRVGHGLVRLLMITPLGGIKNGDKVQFHEFPAWPSILAGIISDNNEPITGQ